MLLVFTMSRVPWDPFDFYRNTKENYLRYIYIYIHTLTYRVCATYNIYYLHVECFECEVWSQFHVFFLLKTYIFKKMKLFGNPRMIIFRNMLYSICFFFLQLFRILCMCISTFFILFVRMHRFLLYVVMVYFRS